MRQFSRSSIRSFLHPLPVENPSTLVAVYGTESRNSKQSGSLLGISYLDLKDYGIRPAKGRFFSPEENDTPRSAPVAVLSYNAWNGHSAERSASRVDPMLALREA